ncbi:hypothetical protein [Streptosporangium lutulentum]|uniref:HNH endonuclease n=1 Tax=Streptosporangium lutulentum TaxID=1461250 RepID=A0ABT9QCD8_9ACTN|nr:hypothetical protein [Streptosporangium lutulentum]MDP9844425.1 hypothetical protein [Streptosporangium lutulentum]
MTHEAAVDGVNGREEDMSLPRRADALRCPYAEQGERRCVLPSGHDLEHVFPHQMAPALYPGD